MLRIKLCEIRAFGPGTQNERLTGFIDQPQDHTLSVQKTTDCAQHLSNEIVRRRCSSEHIQAVGQRLDLSPGKLLGGAQRLRSTIPFNRNSYKVRCQLDELDILQGGTSRFAIVHAKG